MKADAARRAIREKESSIAWTGDAWHNLTGLLNNANITMIAAPNGVAPHGAAPNGAAPNSADPNGATPNGAAPNNADPASPLWADKKADEFLDDVMTLVTTVRTQSKGIHEADTLLLPLERYNRLAQTPRSSTSDTTLLNYILDPKNAYGIREVDWLPDELDNAFTNGTEYGMIAYEKSNEVLEQAITLEMLTHPIQARNLEFVIPVEARHGGVVVRYPLGICIMTGI
jgi:hypothetical protein